MSRSLKVYAANGVELPYTGYIELDMDILGISLGKVAVLVSPMSGSDNPQPTGLLGCNVIREVYNALLSSYGKSYLQEVQGAPSWANALLAYEMGERASKKMGFAKLGGGSPVLIPARSSKVVTCTTNGVHQGSASVVIQAVEGKKGQLPRNVALIDTCSSVRRGLVSAKVINVGDEDVWLQPRTRIGVVSRVQVLQSEECTIQETSDSLIVGLGGTQEVRVNRTTTESP